MREENLFQLATEELNSRDRKTELWARACALATDDVDEARYLYTNLRVEELAKEHNIDLTASAPAPSERGEFTLLDDDKVDETVSLSVKYVDDLVAKDTPVESAAADSTLVASDFEGLTPAQIALERAREQYSNSGAGSEGSEQNSTDNSDNAAALNALSDSDEKSDAKDPHSDLSLADLTADASEVADNTILIDAERGEASEAALNLLDPEDATATNQGLTTDPDKAADPVATSALPILTETPESNAVADSSESLSLIHI